MTERIFPERFITELLSLYTETFERVSGMYLDKGTCLFETLDAITAETASKPISQNCASIAAQVEHVRFYIDTLEQYILGNNPGKVDWGDIWRRVQAVTPDEWQASKNRLRESYVRVRGTIQNIQTWEGEDELGGAMVILVHSAYHLGEIRQALCTVQQGV